MTPADLDRLQVLSDAATPGPWWPRWGGEPGYVYSSGTSALVADIVNGHCEESLDASFIAASRSAVPELIAEVHRLQAALQEVVDVLGPQAGCGECCTGCQCEMSLALEAAQQALPP